MTSYFIVAVIFFLLGMLVRGAIARSPIVKMKDKLKIRKLQRQIEEQDYEIDRMLNERIGG
jgi:uncharacterized membrane protein YciS (DUF1049 family)